MSLSADKDQKGSMMVNPTPTRNDSLPFKLERFETLCDALDYAAEGETGVNFYNLRGELSHSARYGVLRDEALVLAHRLAARFERGSRIAVVAETSPDFLRVFFACQYAGMIPAPMPLPVNLGGKEGYILQIRLMVEGSGASCAVGPATLKDFLEEATEGLDDVAVYSFDELKALPGNGKVAERFSPDEPCYIQYSSGSTSAPKGVIGTQFSVTSNLHAITKHGLCLKLGDRASSWLPLYHDMGLIGFALSPMFAQCSVDYIATSDFVRRPLLWMRMMTKNKATITYSPSFGYELSAKRAARAEEGTIDLSNLRIAGIGGDMVRAEGLAEFTNAFGKFGFDQKAFLPSYGLAEATLAISFTNIDDPLIIDAVDMRHYTRSGVAQPASAVTSPQHLRNFVACGRALPGHAIEIRNDKGAAITEERVVGRVFIKGPSITPGYYSDAGASKAMFDGEWLNTGDMGYTLDGQTYITGRAKDLIIINGRNIWPQDIEWAVEKVDGIRQGGVAAFSVDDGSGESIVVVAERRGMDSEAEESLRREVAGVIQSAAGAPAKVVLARPHSMVLTSSGKLSRAKVKAKYLDGAFDVSTASAPHLLAEARL